MDGVVVYLSGVAPAAVEHELKALQIASAPEPFVYFMYSQDDWTRELEPEELEAIVRRLGQQPSVAAAIACRPGPGSCAALDAVLRLSSTFPLALVDDDFGNLWSHGELKEFGTTAPADGLLGLRTWPGSSG